MRPGVIILFLWLLWALSWLGAAMWSRHVDQRMGLRTEFSYRLFLIVGGIIFAVPAHGYEGRLRLWMVTRTEAWLCVTLIATGFVFCWWARLH